MSVKVFLVALSLIATGVNPELTILLALIVNTEMLEKQRIAIHKKTFYWEANTTAQPRLRIKAR
jgi:hypothetical protein